MISFYEYATLLVDSEKYSIEEYGINNNSMQEQREFEDMLQSLDGDVNNLKVWEDLFILRWIYSNNYLTSFNFDEEVMVEHIDEEVMVEMLSSEMRNINKKKYSQAIFSQMTNPSPSQRHNMDR